MLILPVFHLFLIYVSLHPGHPATAPMTHALEADGMVWGVRYLRIRILTRHLLTWVNKIELVQPYYKEWGNYENNSHKAQCLTQTRLHK